MNVQEEEFSPALEEGLMCSLNKNYWNQWDFLQNSKS